MGEEYEDFSEKQLSYQISGGVDWVCFSGSDIFVSGKAG